MTPYWALLTFFVIGALSSQPKGAADQFAPGLLLGAVIIGLMVGFRFEVGADWQAYDLIFRLTHFMTFEDVISQGEAGFMTLNWLVQSIGAGVWLVNLVCGSFFAWGLYRFCRAQPDPWLCMVIGIPYLVVVVAMGYTRQAAALGFIMAGIAQFSRGSGLVRVLSYIVAAATFHATAVAVVPLIVFARPRPGLFGFAGATLGALALYFAFLASSVDKFVRNYIEAEYNSQGAIIRVALCVIPALIFLSSRSRFRFSSSDELLWRNYSLAALTAGVLVFLSPSTTAVDRIALYLIPLQLVILSRVPGAYLQPDSGRFLIILFSCTIQFVWLNFAAHANAWVPYQLYPF